jgi:hypothetical protein
MSLHTVLSAIRLAGFPIRTSWWTRSKNRCRSTSTTQRRPCWTYRRARHTAVRRAARAEPVAVVGDARVEPRLQDLEQGLLDEVVQHGRDTQLDLPG